MFKRVRRISDKDFRQRFPALWLMFGQVLTEWMWLDVCWAHRQTENKWPVEEKVPNDAWVPRLSHSLSLWSPLLLCLPLSLHHLSLPSPPSCCFSFFILFHFFSLTHSQNLFCHHHRTVTLCFIQSRCSQLREMGCSMSRVWGEKTNSSDSWSNCKEDQSEEFWLLSLGWIQIQISVVAAYCLPWICLSVFSFLMKELSIELTFLYQKKTKSWLMVIDSCLIGAPGWSQSVGFCLSAWFLELTIDCRSD